MNKISLSLLLPLVFSIAAAAVYCFASKNVRWKVVGGGSSSRILKSAAFFAAFFLASFAFMNIGRMGKTESARYLFIFDITPSQMVEDYVDGVGKHISRLQAAKNFFIEELGHLPKNSEVALAGFSGPIAPFLYNIGVFLPLTPAKDVGAIREALELIDWWNAWGDGSDLKSLHVGIYGAVADWGGKLNIVFTTDGGEKPVDATYYDTESMREPVKKFVADSRFLFVGVGAESPSDVPKYDKGGNRIGCMLHGNECYKSALNEKSLQESAAALGGAYFKIGERGQIRNWLTSGVLVKQSAADVNISWAWIASLGSLALFVVWLRL